MPAAIERLHQVRREGGQRQLTLPECLPDQSELELLEIAQTAVEHLRRATRRPGRVVACLDQRHLQPAGGRIEGRTGSHHTTADHDDVELFGLQLVPCGITLPGTEELHTWLTTQLGLL
jgi:hypothetical protein